MVSLPAGSGSVKIYALNPNRVLGVPPSAFVTPDIAGTTYSDTPCLSFLVEHLDKDGATTRLLFDLGIRKDWRNLPPTVVSAIEDMDISITTEKDVVDLLRMHDIAPESIDGIIFSHWHFDHVGDATRFPPCVPIIVGPGFRRSCLPGYPANPDSMVCDDAFADREVREIDFVPSSLSIASLPAVDWFGDGSFYLLHTPGHAVGHISALARTRLGPEDTFVFLAGDVCHHAGELRPHEGHPLPQERSTLEVESGRCEEPARYLEVHPEQSSHRPFYHPSCGGFNLDAQQMGETLEKVMLLDSDERVFVLLAHDHWLLSVIDQFPASMNNWKESNWASNTRWLFLQDFELRSDGGKV